jgi:hypothetical protein
VEKVEKKNKSEEKKKREDGHGVPCPHGDYAMGWR